MKIFIIVLLIDIILGFSMSYFVGGSEPNMFLKIVDEIISFPTSIWNRLVTEKGIYAATTSQFWLVIFFNALIQTLLVYGLLKLFKNK